MRGIGRFVVCITHVNVARLVVAAMLASGCRRALPSTSPDVADASSASGLPSASSAADVTDASSQAVAPKLAPSLESRDPFGVAKVSARTGCGVLAGALAAPDRATSFVDGDDWLALVNRAPTGQLPPDYAPSDMVELSSRKPKTAAECERTLCLRHDAALALEELLSRMKAEGFPGKVESAFRSYGAQCGTFARWAEKSSFCDATEQSALAGHSQHQLGTTVDLFTEAWASDPRGVFRDGFGCTEAGKFLREHVSEFGFAMPYPIHPDDRHPRQSCVTRWDIPVGINPRTGYRYEHWHIRFLGRDAAKRFEEARRASGLGTPRELTLEQWLRAERGIVGADAELPVCDGCNCGACSTLFPLGQSPCDKRGGALHLDEHGLALTADESPRIVDAAWKKARAFEGRMVVVKLEIPLGTITQPPITGLDAARYEGDASFESLAPFPETARRAYAPLPKAWVVALEPVPNVRKLAWPYRAALTLSQVGALYNRANVLLPAKPGRLSVSIPVPREAGSVRVTLLRGGAVSSEWRELSVD